MNELEAQQFEHAYQKHDAGRSAEALQEIRELILNITDPADQAGLLYHEILWLIGLGDTSTARERLGEMRRLVTSMVVSHSDSNQSDLSVSLGLMSLFAEAKVLLGENDEIKALAVLDTLISAYPQQLSLPNFGEIRAEVQVVRGFLLADRERWEEAKASLESVIPLEEQRSLAAYYLGHCYFMLGDYSMARVKLTEALRSGLSQKWECRAHYVLGLTNYRSNQMRAAKEEFELCVRTADPEYLGTTRIWEWLEATCRALGFSEEAANYRLRASSPNSRPN